MVGANENEKRPQDFHQQPRRGRRSASCWQLGVIITSGKLSRRSVLQTTLLRRVHDRNDTTAEFDAFCSCFFRTPSLNFAS